MNKAQFLTALNAAWPGCTVVQVATVPHEDGEMGNYVALIYTEHSEFLATTYHGRAVQCGPQVLGQALARYENASDSVRKLLDAALQADGSRRERAPAPLTDGQAPGAGR